MKPAALKSFRKRKKLTQAAFAEWLGCSKHAVISWENARNPIPEWVVNRLLADTPTVNPVLTLETFLRAQARAEAAGMTLDEWIASLIKDSLNRE